jgi:hypothetical protein
MFTNFAQPPPPPSPPSTGTKTKGKIKASTVIPVAIIIGCLVGAMYFSGVFGDFTNPGTGTLTPTRNIIGTWKTPIATEFTLATDYDDFENLKDVGTEDRTMTLTITATNDETIVNVNVEFTIYNKQITSGSGYIEDTSPMQLTGIINGTQLTLTKEDVGPIKQVGTVGVFTFTTTQMEGTWHDHWEGVWQQNAYTTTDGLKLMKQ